MYSSFCSLFLLLCLHSSTVRANLPCTADSFTGLLPSNTTITLAAPITKFGSFSQNGVNISISSNVTEEALPICVLELNVVSGPNSSFNTGVLLPNSWNGRLLATGNPGFGGGIRWAFQAASLEYGPAVTVSTDTGHIGAPSDISWAINNPDSIIDWAYRSLHESTVLAKELAKTFYGSDVQHSYYTACSNGGRQGLKEVQMFPEDFDGVLAGAPPWQITHLHPYAVQLGLWNLPEDTDHHIPTNKFTAIADLIMEQCDGQDGLVDQIIQEPYSCNLSTTALLCNSTTTNTTTCLTEDQIDTLSLIYNDWQASNGSLLFPRFPLSASPSRYAEVTDAPDHFGLEYLYGFVYNSTSWNWTTFNGEATVDYTNSLNTGDAGALDMDLSEFKSSGGKLIMYHGLADTTIPTGSSIEYFQGVNTTTGEVDDFYQLYLIPGMGHCGESDVAPYFIAAAGQVVTTADGGNSFSVPGFVDPAHDVLLAMMQWVENGTTPQSLIASKWHNNTVEDGISMQRTLCPYPQKAVYDGSSDYTIASSWSCQGTVDLLSFPAQNGSVGTVKAWNNVLADGSFNETSSENTTTTEPGSGGTANSSTSGSAGGKKSGADALRVVGEDALRLAGWAFLAILGVGYMF